MATFEVKPIEFEEIVALMAISHRYRELAKRPEITFGQKLYLQGRSKLFFEQACARSVEAGKEAA